MRDYSYYGHRYSYKIGHNGVAVDLERRVLRVTAKYDGYGKPDLAKEYPLLLVRSCAACGDPVRVYARGSVDELAREAGVDLFSKPWGYGPWTLLTVSGGFALVAAADHKFRKNHHGYEEATCRESGLCLAFSEGSQSMD